MARSTPLAYFDCFHGISGDMTLGALVDAGVPFVHLKRELAKIPLDGYRLRSRRVMRGPLSCRKIDVIQKGLAPGHGKGRHLADIEKLIAKSALSDVVKTNTRRAFHHLAVAEAAVHGETIESIHFHEVGAVDAIVDIAGAMIGFEYLGVDEAWASTVPVGGGEVSCRHGIIPIPGPATLEILRDCPVRMATEDVELTTPTGAAILVTLAKGFGPPPDLVVRAIGTGAGDRDDPDRPNALRLVLGERTAGRRRRDGVYQVETNLDDATPEVIAHARDRALAEGALDAWIVPVQMKKGRAGSVLTALVPGDRLTAIEDLMFRETPTLGVRSFAVRRRVLDRESVRVKTRFGSIEVKIGSDDGVVLTVAPEYESCRKAAERHEVPIRTVYDAARDAYTAR